MATGKDRAGRAGAGGKLRHGLVTALLAAVVAVFLVVKKDFGKDPEERDHSRQYIVLVSLAIGLAVGCYGPCHDGHRLTL